MGRDPLFEFLSDEMPKPRKFCCYCKWFYFDDNTKQKICGMKASSFYKTRIRVGQPSCAFFTAYTTSIAPKPKPKHRRKLMLP